MSYDQDGTAGVGALGIVSETDRETRRAAALLEGKRFVGVEITDHYAGVAEQRIRETLGLASRGDQDALPFGDNTDRSGGAA
jgi:hypothetical protein